MSDQDYRPAREFDNSSQDWAEEGFQAVDDSRSLGSQKSDAGYFSSGAMSDGVRDHVAYAIRSNGSVGSQESIERGSSDSNFRHINNPLMNGETRFPTAMSYVSDAQRSDIATVCSSSVMEDIEVESVLSQEDQNGMSSSARQSPPSSEKPVNGSLRKSTNGTNNGRVVDFVDTPLHLRDFCTIPTRGNLSVARSDSLGTIEVHAMGPPLSRALLLQKAEAPCDQGASANSSDAPNRTTSAFTYDDMSCGSLKIPSHTASKQEGPQGIDCSSEVFRGTMRDASSVKSAGSANAEFSEGSLEVETHSVGTRSVHSQDEATASDNAESNETNGGEEVASQLQSQNLMSLSSTSSENGRRSPGGTIYKGRGVRRYEGRYMHLPLKRFHQNGVHLDSVDEHTVSSEYNGRSSNSQSQRDQTNDRKQASEHQRGHRNGHNGYTNGNSKHNNYQSYDGRRRGRWKEYHRGDRSRHRSRSRSRSSSPAPDDDRKPRANRHSDVGPTSDSGSGPGIGYK